MNYTITKTPELMTCIDGLFIRKPDCYTPYQELFEYMSNEHNVILQMGDIHEIIEIVGRIEQSRQ